VSAQKTKLRRISDYTSLSGFMDSEAKSVPLEDLVDVEIVVSDWEPNQYSSPDGPVNGCAFLGAYVDGGEMFKSVTFSTVLVDQLNQMTPERLPALAKIIRAGSGNREYFTFS